jgi:hypothetical protein
VCANICIYMHTRIERRRRGGVKGGGLAEEEARLRPRSILTHADVC